MRKFFKAAGIAVAALMAVNGFSFALAEERPPEIPQEEQEKPDGRPETGEMTKLPNGGTDGRGEAPEKPDGEPRGMGMPEKISFSDVPDDSWYAEYVRFAAMRGIMEGKDGAFRPDSEITRAEYIRALYKAAGSPEVDAEPSFADVAADSEYAPAVAWAEVNGITVGDGEGGFLPDEPLTREMAMVFLCRAFPQLEITAEETEEESVSDFSDGGDVSDWAKSDMNALLSRGVITGTDEGRLNPRGSLTNAEVAVMLYRVLDGENSAHEGMDGGIDFGHIMTGPGPVMMGGGFGGSNEITNGTSANTVDSDGEYSNLTYESAGDDENALRIDGAEAAFTEITVNKTGGATSNTENGDFYGQNAGLLALNGAQVTIKDSEFYTSAQNGNAVFSYGEGTYVRISDSKITTTADNSGGIQTTGGGATYASNLTVNTSGSSAAAIRSDRGGGTVTVDGGTYTSDGYNSPAIYSTADITVSNAELTANNSEALVIEGKNSITLTDCVVYGNMSDTKGTSSDENVHNVMIYQSMSGDADVGTSEFYMTGGKLAGNNGDLIYVTNTHSIIALSDVELVNNDSDGLLLRVTGNSGTRGWGKAGANGAQVEFTADAQTLEGDIAVDTVSTLTLSLENGAVLTGAVNIVENSEGGTAVENNAAITIDEDSVWNLTGDCVITSLTNNGTVNYNGYTITLADGSVLGE